VATQTVPVDAPREGATDVGSRRAPGSGRPTAARTLGVLALVAMAVLWLLPFAWAVVTSFKSEEAAAEIPPRWIPEDGFTLEAYRNVIATGNLPLWLFNSTVVAVIVTVLTVAVCALAAYGFSRTVFRGRKWLLALTIASIMVPPQILIVPLFYEMLALRLVDTYWGIVLPQVVAPVMVYILKKFFDTIPTELEDAARMDGAGRIRIFWSVVLPLSRGILSAVSIFVFIHAWNNFLWPFIVTNDPALMTMPVGLATVESAYGVQYAQDMASAILAALPLVVIFLFFQRQIIKSVATTGLGGT
jgi:multiple sugar transport system permease protein